MTDEATTTTELANLALDALGVNQPILDLDSDTSPQGKAIRRTFWNSWDSTLQAAPWNCARKRVTLPALTETPAWGFTKYYQLPWDFLSIQELPDLLQGEQWEIDELDDGAQALACSIGAPLKLLYTYKQRNVAKASPIMRDAFTAHLAFQVSMPVTRDDSLRADMWRIFEQKIGFAKQAQGRNRARRPVPDSGVITARV